MLVLLTPISGHPSSFGELEPLVVDWAICVATSPDYSDQNCMEDCFR